MQFILSSINFDFSNISGETLIIAVVGYVIVFSALVMLYFVFFFLPKFIHFNIRRQMKKRGQKVDETQDLSIPGEHAAAISMAIYLYFKEIHDEESNVLTIKKVSKTYSPWSSKIYGLRSYPKIHH